MSNARVFLTPESPLPGHRVVLDVDGGHAQRLTADWPQGSLELFLREVDEAPLPSRLAVLRLDELPQLVHRYGAASTELVLSALVTLWTEHLPIDSQVARGADGDIFMLLPLLDETECTALLGELAALMSQQTFTLLGDPTRLSVVSGHVGRQAGVPASTLLDRARVATSAAAQERDLRSLSWTPRLVAEKPEGRKDKPWLTVLGTFALGLLPPIGLYAACDAMGFDLTPLAYYIVLIALLATSIVIWVESFLALDPIRPPRDLGGPYPKATAIVAAYLPNESATIMATLHALLAQDYAGELQVILAYNTPRRLPIERELRALAQSDDRFLPLYVHDSTSKAQNINAAMAFVEGEFVGLYDADHLASSDSFRRAWRWLESEYDVVQGHCSVRNGEASKVARTVAVEFEQIYAVSHPGRARLHDFGIFGGSNGFWRTSVLHTIRMQRTMLTEDIDSTLRAVLAGYRIASDPELVSRELAPTTLSSLWHQRMRWAQGWHQVSRRHLGDALRSEVLTRRQKAGMAFLLGWREIYPWVSLQMIPIVIYQTLRGDNLKWTLPIFLLTSGMTVTTGPWQVLFAWRLAEPSLRRRPQWFVRYVVTSIFYAELRNTVSRVAQVRELVGTHAWVITARTVQDEDPVALDLRDLPPALGGWTRPGAAL